MRFLLFNPFLRKTFSGAPRDILLLGKILTHASGLIKKRKAKVAVRHAKAGSWEKQSRPMFGSGKINFEVGSNLDAMSFGGIAPVHRLVTKLGLPSAIDSKLELLKVHLPYHESDHVLNMSYNVLCGGTRLEDIERLRHDVAYMNALGADLIPDPTTAGDFNRRFSEADVESLMEAINSVRPKLWQGRGGELLGSITYMDVDGTIAPTYGECKAGMDISYKGIWGYSPLFRWLTPRRSCSWSIAPVMRRAIRIPPRGSTKASQNLSPMPSEFVCAETQTSPLLRILTAGRRRSISSLAWTAPRHCAHEPRLSRRHAGSGWSAPPHTRRSQESHERVTSAMRKNESSRNENTSTCT